MITFIIPTKNEPNVTELIDKIKEVMAKLDEEYAVSLIDCSTDNTPEVARQAGATVIPQKSKGLGGALKESLQMVDTDIAFTMDADMSHNPQHIPAFLSKIKEGYDVVVGSRKMKGGQTINWGLKRHLISNGANFLGRYLGGIKVSDLTSGYRAYRMNAIRSIDLENVKSSGFAFQVEILFHLLNNGFKATSVPIIFFNRERGESKLSGKEIREYAQTVLRLAIYRIFR